VAYGLVDGVEGEDAESATTGVVKRSMRSGVEALLGAIGIGWDDAPDVSDDVNYIPHDVVCDVANGSAIAFDEGQSRAARTKLKEVEDPDLREAPRDERKRAYDNDAKAMRFR
jgi:hypothetical protein